MISKVDWRDIQIALEVYNCKSLRAAASKLRMTESTLSRRVSSLESTLGVVLFERNPSGMYASNAGIRLFEKVAVAARNIENGIEDALGSQMSPSGSVRITTVPILANYVLASEAMKLIDGYPELELDIVGASAELSLMRRETDIALRLARPRTEADNITWKLGMLDFAAFTSTASLQQNATLEQIPWVTYSDEMAHLPQAEWISAYAQRSKEKISPIRCFDAEGLLNTIKAGRGKTILPKRVASYLPEITEIPVTAPLPEREIWLIVHPNISQTRRVRVVIDWLENLFNGN